MASKARGGSSARRRQHDTRWRPRSRGGPVCGYQFDRAVCKKRGAHYCAPRADRAVAVFAELLVHTKGRFARRAFVLDDWQEHEIVRPVFGEVVWSVEWDCYVRRYRIVYIVTARKNGKTEILAGFVVLLMVADDEEAAEIYGAAKDTKQADKVGQVVQRMRELQPLLNSEQGGRLLYNKAAKRMSDPKTGSYYELITADALGELGANPHGFVLDEALSQSDGSLLEAMRTAAGTRTQPMFVIATTETNDPASWGAMVVDEAERIASDPARMPHAFAYVRKLPRTEPELTELRRRYAGHPDLPVSLDVFDEANWRWPNPALGSFKALQTMREEALEAANDPVKENGFRQFQCNQRVSQVTRFMPLHLWDTTAGMVVESKLRGDVCFAGLDLASTTDLAAWVLLFPPAGDRSWFEVVWRFFTPEAQLPFLDRHTGGLASVWARDGLLTATEGDWIDYEGAIHPQIERDNGEFRIVKVGYDQKEATATAQFMQSLEMEVESVYQGFGLSSAIKESMRLVKAEVLHHGGHPVARWNAESVEVKQDDQERLKLVKPQRASSGKRIDGYAGLCNAIRVHELWVEEDRVPLPATGTTGPQTQMFRPTERLRL